MLTVIDSGLQTVKLTAKLMLKEIGWEKKMAMRKEKLMRTVIDLVIQMEMLTEKLMDLPMATLMMMEIGWVMMMEIQMD